jgi:mannose-1-phosphate guanylyltransferase
VIAAVTAETFSSQAGAGPVWGVILAGGVGSRFWPLSTPSRPKQLLPLLSDQPLLVETVQRIQRLVRPDKILVLTNSALKEKVGELLPQIPSEHILAEPRPAGTAAALTWAASYIERRDGPEAVMASVHADWAVLNPASFLATLNEAVQAARRHRALLTVGIVPSRPDPGFGYIRPGEELERSDSACVYRVREFIEKPDRERAAQMVAEGCLWNSGIFVWRSGDFLDEVRAHCHEVAGALLECGSDMRCFFERARNVSVDVGVLERSPGVLVIPGEFGWDDVGTWAALRRVRQLDAAGNALVGRVYAVEASDNVVYSTGNSSVVLFGVQGLVVVAVEDGLVLVTTLDKSADLKELLEKLPAAVRERL